MEWLAAKRIEGWRVIDAWHLRRGKFEEVSGESKGQMRQSMERGTRELLGKWIAGGGSYSEVIKQRIAKGDHSRN